MKLENVDCICGSKLAEFEDETTAICINNECGMRHDVSIPYYPELKPLTSLDEIAKQQALEDIQMEDGVNALERLGFFDTQKYLARDYNQFWSTCFDVNNISMANKCYTCYERERLLSYLDDNGMCQIDTCPENRVAF